MLAFARRKWCFLRWRHQNAGPFNRSGELHWIDWLAVIIMASSGFLMSLLVIIGGQKSKILVEVSMANGHRFPDTSNSPKGHFCGDHFFWVETARSIWSCLL